VKSLKTSTALVSVTDKTGLDELGAAFQELGIHVLASSGTQAFLEGKGITAEEISSYTGSPEILGGRVKTLHPKIHGGILADRDNPDHVRTLEDDGTHPIDFVVVNLYPFEEKYREGALAPEEMVEFIDIGGITLLRAAAKNHRHVTVLTHPSQYAEVISELKSHGSTTPQLRARLAAEVFAVTSTYDAAISRFMAGLGPQEGMPERVPVGLEKVTDVRYGENPHQKAALYRTVASSPLLDMEQLQGKELSFNNYLDIVGAFTLARDLGEQSVSIIKHTNPCGAAWCGDVLHSFRRALKTDSVSAFGGIVAVNGTIGSDLAKELTQMFLEVIIARDLDAGARDLFAKKKNLRVVMVPTKHWDHPERGVLGVLVQNVVLYQEEDFGFPELDELQVVTKKSPSDFEMMALKMAWKVAKHVKSNAIVIGDEEGTVGIGAGQMSRVDSSQIATRKAFDAKLSLLGKVAASDAFFPFPDGVRELAKSGISAVIQPGGSIRDQEVIDAADGANVAMVFTGRRHFRHI
jgi:phosphoribosylaminoimidazolecarboxamide formyltransferase/IMP cyclohydrolase